MLEAEEEVGIELITIEELKAIEAIWNKEFDIRRDRLCKVYEEVKERKLPWAKFVKPIFEDEVIEG